ncbi:MAG: ArsR/SmtB family transcription factor [Acutalibacteraceae bacterium]
MSADNSKNAASGRDDIELASFFKMLSDPTRLKIIRCLMVEDICVNDIASRLNMEQSAVSHQLRVLKTARIADCRRSGKSIYYTLTDENIRSILQSAEKNFKTDKR